MKKIGICLMVVLSFILVGGLAYDFRMSSRYSVVQFQPSDMTAAEIKEEFPEIAFSEKDHTLHADVMALPEVQAALAAEKETIFTSEEGEVLLEEYLTEGMHLEEFSVSRSSCTQEEMVAISPWHTDSGQGHKRCFFVSARISLTESATGPCFFPCIRESFHLQARRFFPGRMVGQFFQQKGDA